MTNIVFTIARKEVDHGHFNHRIATCLLLHGGTCYAYEHLASKGRIVDLHIEVEELILRSAAHALAGEVYAMAHVDYVVDRGHEVHVGLVGSEVRIGLDGSSHLVEVVAIFNLNIYHAAMDALACRNCHREGLLHTFDSLDSYGVTHRHARTEVGISDSLGRDGLKQGAHYGVGTRIPSCRDDAHCTMLLGYGVEATAEVDYLSVDVEAIYGVDTEAQDVLCISFYAAGGSGEHGYIDVLELTNVLHNAIFLDFFGAILSTFAAHDSGYLKVGSGLEGLQGVVTYVAISHYCGTYFLHFVRLLSVNMEFRRKGKYFF